MWIRKEMGRNDQKWAEMDGNGKKWDGKGKKWKEMMGN